MGEAVAERFHRFGRFLAFLIEATVSAAASAVRRPGSVLGQFERVALGSFPLVAAAGASVGLVTWLQLRRLMVQYGFEANLPSVLAAAVLVETGPILASLLVAGRLGAGLAAELGSMNLTEEIDALAVLGTPAVPALVGPRVLACALAVPLLTVVIDASALLGGLAAELTAGTLSSQVYWRQVPNFLRLSDVVPATLKTAAFGLAIGLIGCWTGLNSERSTEAVGRAATRGVVRSMLAVFAVNVVLVPLIQAGASAAGWSG